MSEIMNYNTFIEESYQIDDLIDHVSGLSTWMYLNYYDKNLNYFLNYFRNVSKVISSMLDSTEKIIESLLKGHINKEHIEFCKENVQKYQLKLSNLIMEFRYWYDKTAYCHNTPLTHFEYDDKFLHKQSFMCNNLLHYIIENNVDTPNKLMNILFNEQQNFTIKFCKFEGSEIKETDYCSNKPKIFGLDIGILGERKYQLYFRKFKNILDNENKKFNLLEQELKTKCDDIYNCLKYLFLNNINFHQEFTVGSLNNIKKLLNEYIKKLSKLCIIIEDVKKRRMNNKLSSLNMKKEHIPKDWNNYSFKSKNSHSNNLKLKDVESGFFYVTCSCFFYNLFLFVTFIPRLLLIPYQKFYFYIKKKNKTNKESIICLSYGFISSLLPIAIGLSNYYFINKYKKLKL